jgi:hypothetical protein
MNKRLSFLLIIIALFVASCQQAPEISTPTVTPTLTPIPANPDVLNWHLQFSAANQVQLFRCSVLESINSGTVTLMNPVNVQLSVVPVTPQILEESERILGHSTPDTVSDIASLLENQLIVLVRLDFVTERELYEPYAMLRGNTDDTTLYSLSEIRFEFNNEEFTDNRIILQINDMTYQPSMLIADELQVGAIYPVLFDVGTDSLSTLVSSDLALSVDVGMLVPFKIDTCQTGNYQNFTLHPRIVSGAAHELPALYGSPGNTIPETIVDEFRLALLADVLPTLGNTSIETQTDATETPATVVPEATIEAQSTP